MNEGDQWEAKGFGGAIVNRAKQTCPRHHPYDKTNTFLRFDKLGRPHRHCRACGLERDKEYRAKRAAMTHERAGSGA